MKKPLRDVNEQSAYELWCWGGRPTADEHVESTRRRSSLNPLPIRKLAVAMIENALSDLQRGRPAWWRLIGKDYRPDPDSARAWLHRAGDAPLSARWCEQITGVCLDPLRRKYPLRTTPPQERTQLPQDRRTRRGRPETPARPDDAALREYGF